MSTHSTRHGPAVGLLADQCAALAVGIVFLLLGALAFIPGLVDQLGRLFGVFQVSLPHNLIHLTLGLAGLLLASSFGRARNYLLGGGLVCLGLWLYGWLVGVPNALHLNNADNWLHFGMGVAMLILGLTLAGTRVPRGARGEVLLPPP